MLAVAIAMTGALGAAAVVIGATEAGAAAGGDDVLPVARNGPLEELSAMCQQTRP